MKPIQEKGEIIYLIEGVDHAGEQKVFGLPKNQIEAHWERGSNIKLAQLFGIVDQGIVLVEHVFQGLKRPLCDGEDMDADRLKLVFSWKPILDYCWLEANRFDDSKLETRQAPVGKVFVVILSPNKVKDAYPSTDFWIERWYWVRESNTLAKAPVGWEDRYDIKLK
jgi:hypothetical protein